MEESSSFLRNPWVNDGRSLGSIRNILYLAERTGHLKKDQHEDKEEILASAKCPSLKMISSLREIEKQQTAIDKANLEIQCRLQEKETKDLTHLKHLEKRVEMMNKLNSNLQTVTSRKDELIHRLQQPYVGDYIKIEASYKVYVSEVIPQLVPVLSDLALQLETIEWASHTQLVDPQMDSLLAEISGLLAGLQSSFRSMLHMRRNVHQLYHQRKQQTDDGTGS